MDAKTRLATILPKLQAAKAAHKQAYEAAKLAQEEYARIRAEYAALCMPELVK